MASKSLGTLTLDLVAKTGGFVAGMDKAERSSAKWKREVQKNMDAAGKAVGAASAVAVGALAVWVKSSINSAAEIQNLAKVANVSTTEFQKFAAGARTVGIENDKLSDILKDVNDKVGDFLVTGGGELKEFFEQVAPKVGVTAEQFRNLSGPQALGLYVDTLEKAGANQQEMTFFLEAIANDATLLAPLLRNGGKEMRGLADEAQNLGLILSEETIAGAKQFNDDLDLLGRVAGGVGQQIAAELLPDLLELTNTLRDPQTAKAAADMAKAVVGSFTTIIDGARNTVQFIQWAAESAAAFMNGIAADDLVRLNDEIERLEEMKASGALDRLVFFGRDGIVKLYSKEEIDAELAELRAAAEAAMQGGKPIALPVEPKLTSGPSAGGPGLNLGGGQSEEAAKAAEKAAAAITKQVEALQEQADTLGMSSEALAIYNLEQAKASDAQMAQARAALETISAYEKQKEQTEAYAELVASLRTEEEQLTDQMRERLAVLDAMQGIEPDERMQVAGRIAGAATSDAPEFGGLAPEVGGALGELLKIDEAEEKLQEWYDTQLEMLEQFRQDRADLAAVWDEEELALKQQHEDELARIEQARQMAQLASAESIFGDLAGLTKTFAGEQSGLYKAMFAVQKAAAIAQSMVAIQTGIAMAAANPFPANLAAMASVAAATASIVSNIGAIGMAHEGIDAIPETGTWLLEKGERVTTAETSAKLDKTLSDIQSGGTGAPVVNLYEDASKAGTVSNRQENGQNVIDIFVSDIMSDGKAQKAISRKFGIQGVGQ
ncbi:phage tail tape measure protein [Pseudomonas sp. PS1]|uniref:Phage tail tape measure protein n=1 Tax=Stutzerimonas marianensis TaxID=2929513 RepID=A0A9X1W3G9_9GAMM|nr:phage tail tape measure protein [Pseudomonas marianensis]MCJ0972677.1 phage tail tape measure protein [Pseudomonas marianensis]